MEYVKRVALVTTMWDQVPSSVKAQMEAREEELRNEYWTHFVKAGVQIHRFDTRIPNRPWEIVTSILEKNHPAEAILLQKELVDLRHDLSETEAAKLLYSNLMQGMAAHKDMLIRLERNAHASRDSKEEARLKSEIEEVNRQIDKSFEALKRLKVPLGRRIALWFRRVF
jgi:hypothetical protein